MNLPFSTLRDLAIHLRERYFPHLHTLPYNRFDLDKSPYWWLSPTGENPAFRHGKAGISANTAWVGDDDVFCGFSIEKGVLHEGFTKNTEVMDDDWAWHRFVKRANVPLAEMVRNASEATSLPIKIVMTCGAAGADARRESLCFDASGDQLLEPKYREVDGILKPVAASTNFASFADSLRAIDGKPTAFHWVDLAVGATFTMNPAGPDDTEICAKLLTVFSPWMREGG